MDDRVRTIAIEKTRLLGTSHSFAYEILAAVAEKCGFDSGEGFDQLLIDLAIMRVIEPSSKLRAVELLDRYFDIKHTQHAIYRRLPGLHNQKEVLQAAVLRCVLDRLGSELSLVLYDVTTLYFESFKDDELRTRGFSKDNKPSQSQIVIGLLVSRDGFPLAYEIFAGNTFEGKTMIPVLEEFARAHDVKKPVVVADAAMLSKENITELKQRGLSFIVGARLANLPLKMIEKISTDLSGLDGKIARFETPHGDLIVSFSSSRYRKNLGEMQKQLIKAQDLIASKEPGRRAKFIRKETGNYALNEALVAKTRKLLGIRGYYTNLTEKVLPNHQVIGYYHDLWRVEQAFRMTKSDLAARPIFHHSQNAIKTHILICFTALAITKYIELTTGATPRKTKDLLWSVTNAKILDTTTGQEFPLRTETGPETMEFLEKLGLSH